MNQEPKRILQVVTYMGRGGIETMLMNYYRRIDRNRLQFDFLVHRNFRADFDDEIEALGGRIYRVPPMNPLSPAYQKALRNFFREHPYEVVHCHLNYKSGIVLAAAKQAGVPVRIAHAHIASMQSDWKQAVRKMMKILIPHTATNLLACGQEAGRAVFGKHSFALMANAINGDAFRYNEATRQAKRKELNLGSELAIMHVGRFDYQKNHVFLIDLFSEVIEREATAKLVLVGDGAMRPEIEDRARQRLPQGSVMFLGTRSDIPELLQAADVFVFPSHFEGLPVTVIEAQAAGLPCIKSDAVTSECVVTDLVESLPITDPKLWAEAILCKKNHPRNDQLAAIQASGYDITTAAVKLEQFYLNGDPL